MERIRLFDAFQLVVPGRTVRVQFQPVYNEKERPVYVSPGFTITMFNFNVDTINPVLKTFFEQNKYMLYVYSSRVDESGVIVLMVDFVWEDSK